MCLSQLLSVCPLLCAAVPGCAWVVSNAWPLAGLPSNNPLQQTTGCPHPRRPSIVLLRRQQHPVAEHSASEAQYASANAAHSRVAAMSRRKHLPLAYLPLLASLRLNSSRHSGAAVFPPRSHQRHIVPPLPCTLAKVPKCRQATRPRYAIPWLKPVGIGLASARRTLCGWSAGGRVRRRARQRLAQLAQTTCEDGGMEALVSQDWTFAAPRSRRGEETPARVSHRLRR